jgi:glycosyltransferase involved in cell wall biosynthesis
MSTDVFPAPPTMALVHPEMSLGVTSWRVAQPYYELATQGFVCSWQQIGTQKSVDQMLFAELVVLLRGEWAVGEEDKAVAFRDFIHEQGKVLCYDTDDDLYSPASVARVRSTGDAELNARSDEQLDAERQARIFALSLCDGVTVSTEHLAEVVRRYTSAPVIVVPNAIDLPRFRAALLPRPADRPLTIGWAGGNRPDADAKQLAIAWSRVADRYPDVRFLVGGYSLQALIKAVPESRLTVVPKLPLSIYPQIYGMIDIGCAPLNDEPFNWSKSYIKGLEFGAAKSALCASPIVYGSLVNQGFDGFLCESANDWDQAISCMVENEPWRQDMASRLFTKVEREHSLSDQAYRWPEAWMTIVAEYRSRHGWVAAEVGGRSA